MMKYRSLNFLILMAFLGHLSCVTVNTEMSHETLVNDWRDEIIYQIVVDRFEDGDVSNNFNVDLYKDCLLYTSPSPRDRTRSRMPSSA